MHIAHVADVMAPLEVQVCVGASPARARACTVGWCVMARGGAKACGRGAAARCAGVGCLAARPRHAGPRLTCLRRCTCQQSRPNSLRYSRCRKWDVLLGERHYRRSCSWNRNYKRCRNYSKTQNNRIKKHKNRIHNRYRIHNRHCNRSLYRTLRCGQEGSGKFTQGGGARAGRADTPGGVATRSHQPPPIACAVDFARDRRLARDRRPGRDAFWELPTAGRREHGEEDEHSAHRFGRGGRATERPHR